MPDVDDVELALWQPLVEKLAVDRWHRWVSRTRDDLDRRLDLRQQIAENRQLRWISAHVAHRFDEPVSLVGGEVVLADVIGKRVPLEIGGQRAGHGPAGVGAAVSLEVGGFGPVLQRATQLERKR